MFDFSTAGIVVTDDSGRRVDFHALRMTYCTLLAANGIPLNQAIRLMRHCDPKLTVKICTGASQLELGESIAKLPTVDVRLGQRACNC